MQYEISGKSLLFNNGQLRILKRLANADDALNAFAGKGQFETMELIYFSGRINFHQANKETPPSIEDLESEIDVLMPKDMVDMLNAWSALIYERNKPIDDAAQDATETKKN